MSNTASEIPRFERQLPPPEGVVENYKYAVKEGQKVLRIEDLLRRGTWRGALGRMFLGWGNAQRYNEAMRGVGREQKRASDYSKTYLDLLHERARQGMESESAHRYDDGSVPPEQKEFPEDQPH